MLKHCTRLYYAIAEFRNSKLSRCDFRHTSLWNISIPVYTRNSAIKTSSAQLSCCTCVSQTGFSSALSHNILSM